MKIKFILPIVMASAILVSCKEEMKQRNIEVTYPETIKKTSYRYPVWNCSCRQLQMVRR